MNLASAQHLHNAVADLCQPQRALDDRAMICRHRNRVQIPNKIGGMQHVDMQSVALDPLTTIKEAAKKPDRRIDAHTQSTLHRVHRTHLVGDGTDAANSRGDVGRFRKMTPSQKRFEQSGRLVYFQLFTSATRSPARLLI